VKPLLGQLQNQTPSDDFLGSALRVEGKFDRAANTRSINSNTTNSGPSFSDMLLKTIVKGEHAKNTQSKPSVAMSPSHTLGNSAPILKRTASDQNTTANNSQVAQKLNKQPISSDQAKRINPAEARVSERKSQNDNDGSQAQAKAALAPLRKQFSGKASSEALLNGNAVLAFITGRLDKITPDALASVITDSSLIRQAVSSGDIDEFMQTPLTISDLGKLFEVDQGILNKAAMNGLDAADIVTPKDFINAIGLDVGRISAELTQLQQRLPVDGIKAYIERAKAMAAAQENAAETLQTTGIQNVGDSVNSAAMASMDQRPILEDLSSQSHRGDQAGSQLHGIFSDNISTQAAYSGMIQSNQPQSTQKSNDVLLTKDVRLHSVNNNRADDLSESLSAIAIGSGNSFISQASMPPTELIDPAAGALSQIGSGDDATLRLLDVTSPDSHLVADDVGLYGINFELMNGPSSTDPFVDIGQLIDPSQSTKIEFGGDGLTQRTLEELLIDHQLDQNIFDNAKNKSIHENISTLISDPQSPINNDFQTIQLNQNQVRLENALASSSLQSASRGFTSDGMLQDHGSSSGGESPMPGQSIELGSAFSTTQAAKLNTQDAFVNRLATNDASLSPKDGLAGKILSHAQMMLKDGGGSMRINVEAPGMGHVDVAINLINNQLDVRIITASEQARDMISREVTGLRDGLGQQGISLRGLEIGKAGESSGRQFAGQGQQQFGQGARDQRPSYDDMRQYVQSFRNAYSVGQSVAPDRLSTGMLRSASANMKSMLGRLEVRV
jgi:flagellar hook-length control protein FliK